MAAIAYPIPAEVTAVLDELDPFLEREVLRRHRDHHAALSDPRHRYDADGRYTPEVQQLIREVRMASSSAGFFNLAVPTHMGGRGMGYLAYYSAWEHIKRRCGSHNWLGTYVLSHWAFGPSRVLEQLSPQAKADVLPDLVAGRTSMSFGLSEPDAGSDAANLRTTATPDGDGWRLNGTKIWTTNVTFADWILTFAVTDPDRAAARRGGISAFMVPIDAPGFRVEEIVLLNGEIGGVEGRSTFTDVRVEPWQLVGPLHEGFSLAIMGVSLGRVYNAARAVGYARWALDLALDHTATRVTFGKPIAEYQGVTFPLADSAMQVHAAHLMGINAAALLDRGERAIKELSMAKCYAVQVCLEAVDRAIQTFGARGFRNELGLVEAYHTLRAINVADGTNEILSRTIFQRLAAGDREL